MTRKHMSHHRARQLQGSVTLAVLAAAATVLVVPGSGTASRQHSQSATGGPPQVVSTEILPDGAMRERFSNGSVFVGNPAAQVQFVLDSSGATVGGTVTDAGPASPSDAAAWAAAYAAHGRSPRADAAAAGIDPSTQPADNQGQNSTKASSRSLASASHHAYNWQTANVVYDSGCLTLNDTPAYWHGCYIRKGTSSTDCCAFYLADESQAAGHANLGGYWLNSGYTQNQYANTDLIVQWNPNSDVSGNNCTNTGFSLSDFGATLSESVNNCPVKIHVYDGTQRFLTTWQGCLGSQYTPGTTAENWTHVPSGDDWSLIYSIGYTYQTSSC